MVAASSDQISLEVVLRFVDAATDALAEAREEIDALNVYPVPDGDTGTNLHLTVSAARDAMWTACGGDPGADLGPALAALARGALLGARGNSGVILSQMLGAVGARIVRAGTDDRNAEVLAAALRDATDASYAAVGEPVEGTMLTVARAASDAALEAAADPRARTADVLAAAATSAREALARTPEQLTVLRDAGVVDAGGRGITVILDAAEAVLTGRRAPAAPATLGRPRIPVPVPADDLSEDGPAYEVMYLLDADDERIPPLREALGPLGDSLVVVGGEGLWNVHVHVDDVGAAIEAGIEAGRPHRVRVTHFAEQVAAARRRTTERKGRRIVAVAAGPGLEALFNAAGAHVVRGGPGMRPSTQEVLDAIREVAAEEVVLLPNDPDSVRVATVAAETAEADDDIRVVVIPTRAQVQGLAALAVHEPGRSFDQDVLEMTATARHARDGAVTVAARHAMTMAGPCEPGDVLGVIAGDFAVVGSDLHAVATDVLDRLLRGGGELVTLVRGQDDPGDLAERCAAWVGERHPHVDVVVHEGGQQRYPLLVGVE
ncbi:DAK2 domain-containing protein [Nocardioides coralli]|uniref:DAK2 domain-containing protein n=1 Tax=Nocardioides coralli TaxID=2872154 RepID=UPI001CA4330E|nr:DAK2 domain-containing protein [Nocardioides coralli]QZY28171.1 DAK2 domain-containing protein [Nocardioides coralli]